MKTLVFFLILGICGFSRHSGSITRFLWLIVWKHFMTTASDWLAVWILVADWLSRLNLSSHTNWTAPTNVKEPNYSQQFSWFLNHFFLFLWSFFEKCPPGQPRMPSSRQRYLKSLQILINPARSLNVDGFSARWKKFKNWHLQNWPKISIFSCKKGNGLNIWNTRIVFWLTLN